MCVLRRKVTGLLMDAMETQDFCIRSHVRIFYLLVAVIFSHSPHAAFWAILKPCHVWRKCFNKGWAPPLWAGKREGQPLTASLGGPPPCPRKLKKCSLTPQPPLLDAKSWIWWDSCVDNLHLFLLVFLLMCVIKDLRALCEGLEDRAWASQDLGLV